MSQFPTLIVPRWYKLLYRVSLFCMYLRISLLIHFILYLKFSLSASHFAYESTTDNHC